MASTFGRKFRVTLGGTPGEKEITVKIEGIPEGAVIDYGKLSEFIGRWDDQEWGYGGSAGIDLRSSGVDGMNPNEEEAEHEIIWKRGVTSFGTQFGIVTDIVVEAAVENPPISAESMAEWEKYRKVPRPGHADFAAVMKDGPQADLIGGGRFSDRLTLGLCIAGGVARQILEGRGVEVLSDVAEISGSKNQVVFEDMIESTMAEEDSVGGVVECAVMGLAAGSCGDSYFNGLQGQIAQAVFAVPGISGVEFGSGFEGTALSGSENNDTFVVDEDGHVRTSCNNHGGILGGVASGMPVVLRAAVSPCPTIGKEQKTVNLETMKPEYITIKERKSGCSVGRAAVCVEAAAAIAVLDALLAEEKAGSGANCVDDVAGKPFGLLGKKLGHSFSPEIHRKIGEAIGRPYEYVLFEKEPDELEAFIKGGQWAGLNVTVPYKEKVIPFLDELSDEAAAIGAVNTIVRRNGRLVGYNTDYYGFMQMLDTNKVPVAGSKCLVLGAGGASKAVTAVLDDMGADQVVVMSRRGSVSFSDLADHKDADILVNTTPVGMYPDSGKSLVYPGTFLKLTHVVDVIYNPLRTNLLCQAKKSLMETVSGLEMLVSQAVFSAMLFIDQVIEEKDRITAEITSGLRTEKQNLVLIGMPGAGKTTVGEILADRLGREIYDTDEMVIARDGRKIPEIFSEDGEEYFRDLESAAASELSQKTGIVVSCGGGIITREENYYALAENSFIVFINRDISVLPTDGRPLSQSQPLERLYQARLPLYRGWCDAEVDINGLTPEETADRILEMFRA